MSLDVRALVLGLLLAVHCSAGRADAVVDEARGLVDRGDPKGAYRLLAPLESDRAGDPEFDLLLGIAAIDAGRNTEAVFALERVLVMQPDNARARAEIARAYFNLKETTAARREFERVKQQNPPPDVGRTIDRYLSAIQQTGSENKPTARAFIETFAGHDSNVNSATADRSVAVPAFGGLLFTLGPGASRTPDTYWGLAAGVSAQVPFNARWTLLVGFIGSRRWNQSVENFDSSSIDFNAGARYRVDRDTYTLAAQVNDFTVYDPIYTDTYREARGATVQWQRDVDARNQISLYGQYAKLVYPDQRVRNAARYVIGGGYARAMSQVLTMYAGAYIGKEETESASVTFLGNDLVGMRVGGDRILNDQWTAFGTAAFEYRNYRGVDPTFLVVRQDHQVTATAGVAYVPARNWRVTPQLLWFRNNSNIVINEFDRLLAEVRVRRDF